MGKTYRFCNLTENERVSLKKKLTLLKMYVFTSLLCGLWVDLGPF